MPVLRLETVIAAPAEECFDLSLSVDAHTNSMSAAGERVIAGVMSGGMTLGDSVTWRARHFGIPFRMTSKITAYERPSRFVDEQVRGPFRAWRHEHSFVDAVHGTTLMIDAVEFYSPFGLVGVLANGVVLRRYMFELLRRRNDWLKQTLEANRPRDRP